MDTENEINIFIVDDNDIFSLALKSRIESFFSDKPLKIQLFETGEDCMSRCKEISPQIVILDYTLNTKNPDAANGIDILISLKKDYREAFVIMLTGNDQIEIAIKSFQYGASDYVVKSDTKFHKVIFSLLNIIKVIEANYDTVKYLRELKEYKKNSKA